MAMIMSVTPFAIDAYLPALPYMASSLAVGPNEIATTITCYILGIAFGQIIGGPLADNFGKKIIIILGLSIYALSALIISHAETLLTIQIFRVIQAMGGGFSVVCISPLVRERAAGNEAAKIFGLVSLIMIGAPAIAPSLGALILLVAQWQTIFYFLCAYSILVIAFTAFNLPTDKVQHKQSITAIKRYAIVLQNRPAMRYIIVQGFSQSVMIIFVTNASFIYQQYFGLTDQVFALAFAANIVGLAIINRINSRLLSHYLAQTLLKWALRIQGVCVILFMVFVYVDAPVSIQAISIICMVATLGATTPNCNATYISHFKQNTGSASALFGANQFFTSAIMGGLTTFFYDGTLWPIAFILLFSTVIANFMVPINKSMS